ncbi:MAG: hypothetical protein AAB692_04330 [Patescibacteria group bacterium]
MGPGLTPSAVIITIISVAWLLIIATHTVMMRLAEVMYVKPATHASRAVKYSDATAVILIMTSGLGWFVLAIMAFVRFASWIAGVFST